MCYTNMQRNAYMPNTGILVLYYKEPCFVKRFCDILVIPPCFAIAERGFLYIRLSVPSRPQKSPASVDKSAEKRYNKANDIIF